MLRQYFENFVNIYDPLSDDEWEEELAYYNEHGEFSVETYWDEHQHEYDYMEH